jgi:hypothetical protein
MDAMAQEEFALLDSIAVLNYVFRTRFLNFYWKVSLLIRETHMIKKIREN